MSIETLECVVIENPEDKPTPKEIIDLWAEYHKLTQSMFWCKNMKLKDRYISEMQKRREVIHDLTAAGQWVGVPRPVNYSTK